MNQSPYATFPAPQKKRRRVWPWLVAAALLAVVVVAGVSGSQNDDQGTGTQDIVTAAPAQPADPAAAPQAPVPAGPATDVSDGIHQVGVDIAPGQYKTAGPDMDGLMPSCYWARLLNDSGEFSAIISNGNIQGPGSVTLNTGEFVELMGGCVWNLTG